MTALLVGPERVVGVDVCNGVGHGREGLGARVWGLGGGG
jgi:hypothetical protein